MLKRSLFLVIACILFSAHAALSAAPSPARSKLESQVAQIAARHHGLVAVFAEDLTTGKTVSLKSDEPVATASVIKLAILYEAMRQLRQSRVHWNDSVTVGGEDQTAGSGVLGYFDAVRRVPQVGQRNHPIVRGIFHQKYLGAIQHANRRLIHSGLLFRRLD